MDSFEPLSEELAALRRNNLYRSLEPASLQTASRIRLNGKTLLNFSSNNYLALAEHPGVKKKAAAASLRWGGGSGASRLISGNLALHENLEKEIAALKKEEAALVFSSGYLANLGAVTALLNEEDVVFVDRLNHASLIDAARLSRAKLKVYPHCDAGRLDALLAEAKGFRRKMVLTDAYFSMDGDIAPLDRLWEVCGRQGAMLMVDEAHSTGVFGPTGSGLSEEFGLSGKIHVVMGTLSKALGSVGGFVAGQAILKEYLVNRSREFIYTTAPSPAASAAAMEAIRVIRTEPARRRRYWENISFFRKELEGLGFDLMGSVGPIVPLRVGNTAKVLDLRKFLRENGVFAPAIRPPTVPKDTDRMRFSVTAGHSKKDLSQLVEILKKAKVRAL